MRLSHSIMIAAVCLLLTGCAENASDAELLQLNRQQNATIASLTAEVEKLNQELEETADAREVLEAARPKLERLLREEIARGDVNVATDRAGLVITIRDRALFDPEAVTLLPAGEEILDKLVPLLSGELSGQKVIIEGHTDDQPLQGAQDFSNWEYAADCAGAVLHYFVDTRELEAQRFSFSSFGEYRPLGSNANEEGRSRNRRISVVILP